MLKIAFTKINQDKKPKKKTKKKYLLYLFL